mmetsp:Transcript_117187/g.250420  ORF Transcript_117187/g.250420 Transcript_117187/m.250420 type:complete len:202 (+) Transcript_117187:69-674(+)
MLSRLAEWGKPPCASWSCSAKDTESQKRQTYAALAAPAATQHQSGSQGSPCEASSSDARPPAFLWARRSRSSPARSARGSRTPRSPCGRRPSPGARPWPRERWIVPAFWPRGLAAPPSVPAAKPWDLAQTGRPWRRKGSSGPPLPQLGVRRSRRSRFRCYALWPLTANTEAGGRAARLDAAASDCGAARHAHPGARRGSQP